MADTQVKSVNRLDMIDSMNWMTTPFTRTIEGFLKGRAIVTNVGVFTYQTADGGIQLELRLPEEVFSYDSLESLKLKPVCLDHPKEAVTPANIKQYQVGSLGNNPGSDSNSYDWNGNYIDRDKRSDGYHLAIDMTVTENDAIEAVLNGKQSLSCGYNCELEKAEPGAMWCGMKYDYIQRKIRYNHVAIVDAARAGDAAKIRLDGADAILIDNKLNKEDTNMADNLKKITLDGVEYNAEPEVIKQLTQRNDEVAKMKVHTANVEQEHSKMCGERDAWKDKCDKLQKQLDEAKAEKEDPKKKEEEDSKFKAAVDAAVDAKVRLLVSASQAEVDTKDKSDADIRKAIILKVFPNAKLDGRDDAYLAARFDAATEELATMDAADASVRQFGGSFSPETETQERGDGKAGKDSPAYDSARDKYIQRLRNDSRGIKKED